METQMAVAVIRQVLLAATTADWERYARAKEVFFGLLAKHPHHQATLVRWAEEAAAEAGLSSF